MAPDFLEVGSREGDVLRSAAARASQRTKHAIRAAMHCEVVITRANERAICPHIKVLANEGLFIIGEHKSSHNPISCPLIPVEGRGEAHLGRRWTKGSKQGFGSEKLRLLKLDPNSCLLLLSFLAWIRQGEAIPNVLKYVFLRLRRAPEWK